MTTNKTDRELLELAAKAAGYVIDEPARNGSARMWVYLKDAKPNNDKEMPIFMWNPHYDDGDVLRLQVALGIAVTPYPVYGQPKHSVIAKQYRQGDMMREPNPTEVIEPYNGDPYAATRRAIVRAAAAIGEALP